VGIEQSPSLSCLFLDSTTKHRYHDVVGEVGAELVASLEACRRAGIPRWLLIADPGLGFAKEGGAPNLALMGPRGLGRLSRLVGRAPLLAGPSRKRFLAGLGEPPAVEEKKPVASSTCLEGGAKEPAATTSAAAAWKGQEQGRAAPPSALRPLEPIERDAGTAACACACAVANWHSSGSGGESCEYGGSGAVVAFVRVHDVPGAVRSLAAMEAILAHDE
jgi:dihydropteroate synthase